MVGDDAERLRKEEVKKGQGYNLAQTKAQYGMYGFYGVRNWAFPHVHKNICANLKL